MLQLSPFVVTSYFHSPQRPVGMFYSLILPIGMSVVVIVASHKIDRSMREAFLRVVQIEDLLGLFILRHVMATSCYLGKRTSRIHVG